ncbi:unnamed protein product [Paramecium primaurelia]|uniref:Uncharacterized protein n=1 Tax=Paramecium primaurelia TaxID=5886 RepID=A0A8S1QNZ4_PARPR|nr:unnamed protein product [Paramecium primaurelia]
MLHEIQVKNQNQYNNNIYMFLPQVQKKLESYICFLSPRASI